MSRITKKLAVMVIAALILTGCGNEGTDKTITDSQSATFGENGPSTDMDNAERKTDVINAAKSADVKSAKLIGDAVYSVLADEKIFDEIYEELDGKVLAWAKSGERFEDGGAGHERFLRALNSREELAGGTPVLQYNERLIITGTFIPKYWAVSYSGGKVYVYICSEIYGSFYKDYAEKVEIYPTIDRNYEEKMFSDQATDAKEQDLRSVGELKTSILTALASEKVYNDLLGEMNSGRIIAWAKEGEAFECGENAYASFAQELNPDIGMKSPSLQYKGELKNYPGFTPGGWAIAFKNDNPVIYITDGTMTRETAESALKVEVYPNVDYAYKY